MFNTKYMGLAVLFVALAVTANALAFRTAQVTSALSLTVSSTDTAALAFDAATAPESGVTTTVPASGKLSVAIGHNMQPDSIYTFENAFKITNTTSDAITLSYSPITLTGGVTVELLRPGGLLDLGGLTLTAVASAPANTTDVKLRVTVPAGFVGGGGTLGSLISGSVVVTGTR